MLLFSDTYCIKGTETFCGNETNAVTQLDGFVYRILGRFQHHFWSLLQLYTSGGQLATPLGNLMHTVLELCSRAVYFVRNPWLPSLFMLAENK